MYIKSSVVLIYEGKGTEENGSPINLVKSETVMCDEMETFSNQYYTDQQRNMRKSRNLVIPTYLTNDIVDNGVNYELMYVIYDGIEYKVRNILKLKGTRQRMILDVQEVR